MNMATEPTRIVGYSVTIASAIIGVLIAFGADISDPQRDALLSAVGTIAPIMILTVELIRSRVVSPKATAEAVAIAKELSPESNVVPDVKVANFRHETAKQLGKTQREITWRPPVEAH